MRIYILLLALLSLAGCSVKSVETVYHEAGRCYSLYG